MEIFLNFFVKNILERKKKSGYAIMKKLRGIISRRMFRVDGIPEILVGLPCFVGLKLVASCHCYVQQGFLE